MSEMTPEEIEKHDGPLKPLQFGQFLAYADQVDRAVQVKSERAGEWRSYMDHWSPRLIFRLEPKMPKMPKEVWVKRIMKNPVAYTWAPENNEGQRYIHEDEVKRISESYVKWFSSKPTGFDSFESFMAEGGLRDE